MRVPAGRFIIEPIIKRPKSRRKPAGRWGALFYDDDQKQPALWRASQLANAKYKQMMIIIWRRRSGSRIVGGAICRPASQRVAAASRKRLTAMLCKHCRPAKRQQQTPATARLPLAGASFCAATACNQSPRLFAWHQISGLEPPGPIAMAKVDRVRRLRRRCRTMDEIQFTVESETRNGERESGWKRAPGDLLGLCQSAT